MKQMFLRHHFELDIRNKLFIRREVMDWNWLPREVVDVPS